MDIGYVGGYDLVADTTSIHLTDIDPLLMMDVHVAECASGQENARAALHVGKHSNDLG